LLLALEKDLEFALFAVGEAVDIFRVNGNFVVHGGWRWLGWRKGRGIERDWDGRKECSLLDAKDGWRELRTAASSLKRKFRH
jgi:hypothetical protein